MILEFFIEAWGVDIRVDPIWTSLIFIGDPLFILLILFSFRWEVARLEQIKSIFFPLMLLG